MHAINTKIGRYQLVHKIASGGMAEIYLSHLMGVEGFEKKVVIKKILPQWSGDPQFSTMLIDEARILLNLNHPNIVQVYELDRHDDELFIVMEYVEGWDLRHVLSCLHQKNKKPPLAVVLFVISEVLAGLAYAHQKKESAGKPLGIIHRDISPQNILLSREGLVKITDFGIAKATLSHQQTAHGVIKGKLAYLSPEQLKQGDLDSRSDLFSVGLLFYELLSGSSIYEGCTEIQILNRLGQPVFELPENMKMLFPAKLLEFFEKSLCVNPIDRFQTALEFRQEILEFALAEKQVLSSENLAAVLSEHMEEPGVFGKNLFGETRVGTEETHSVKKNGKSRRLFPAVFSGVFLLLFLLWFWENMREDVSPVVFSQKINPLSSPVPEPPVSSTSPVKESSPLAVKEIVPKKNEPKTGLVQKKVSHGFLSIKAVPWAYITMDQDSERWETPIHRLQMSAGIHEIHAFYEPEQKQLSRTVEIVADKGSLCVVNFQRQSVSCGEAPPEE